MALVARYFPGADPSDPLTMARAIWLDKRDHDRMTIAVQNAIARALSK